MIGDAIGRRLAFYSRLARAGARWRSIVLFPLRRRIRPRRARIDFRTGQTLIAPPDEPLLTMVDEIWIRRSYLPAGWGDVPRPTVIDVGANVGVFSVWAATQLGAGHVIAVEPSPSTAAVLLQNLARNGVNDPCVLQVALGAARSRKLLYRRGPAVMDTLFDHDSYGSAFRRGPSVAVITLDDVFAIFAVEHCDLLKLDCEGSEYDILFAASAATLGKIDHIVAEYHVGMNRHDVDALDRFLQDHGLHVTRFPPLDVEGGHLHASRRP